MYVRERFGFRRRFKDDSAGLPVEVLHMIGEDHARDLACSQRGNGTSNG